MTAEEEKLRLFQQAQAAVQKNQGLPYTAPPSTHARNDSDLSVRGQPSSGSSGTKPQSAAAALYAQAINAQTRSAHGSGPSPANSTSPSRTKPAVPQYLTADEEKAALKRYEEAKRAVDRIQQSEFEEPSPNHAPSVSAPIAYESLFPAAASTSHPGGTDEPPPFDSSAVAQSQLSEKERVRRAYEANDAAARARQNEVNTPPPPPDSPPTHGQYTNALEEKEALRRKFEARDNAQAKGNPAPQPPPRSNGGATDANSATRSPSSNRPTPLPPAAATSRILTAAEEKALLRAKFEARDAPANRIPAVTTNGNNSQPVSSTPPPLMPRPPVEYIKETQEEDARVSRLNGEVPVIDFSSDISRRGTPKPHGTPPLPDPNGGKAQAQVGVALDMRPFSPFRAAFEGSVSPLSSPPLPTKPV